MLCEIQTWGNFLSTWLILSIAGLVAMFIMSGSLFWKYYMNPTFESWRYKSNPKYPEPEKVRDEILLMLKGLYSSTFCPALALFLSQHGYSQAYCGVENYGVGYLIGSFFFTWIFTDFWEFYYHRQGHTRVAFWNNHRFHHQFYNPSPFAVISDEWVDQFARSLPLLILPLMMPINMDMLFLQYGVFFYGYGCYLHWGFELDSIDAHHPWINTAFQHHLHHAKSINQKPYHTGFFFKLWDQLYGSVWDQECFCCKCAQKKGERTKEIYDTIRKPNYSPLFKVQFWLDGVKSTGSLLK